jgi:uncharacterized protein (DUF2164 family)
MGEKIEKKKMTAKEVWDGLEKETDETIEKLLANFLLMDYTTMSNLENTSYNQMVSKLTKLQFDKRNLNKKIENELEGRQK